MAEEKTEQPSEKRLRDAREKGDVPKSTEVVSAATVLAVFGYFIANASNIFKELTECFNYVLATAPKYAYAEGLRLIGSHVVETMLVITAPVVACALIGASLSLLVQVGVLFAPQGAMPKLSNLNPKNWFKKVFAVKNLIEFIKNLIKVVVLSYVVYIVASKYIVDIFKLAQGDIGDVWTVAGVLIKDIAIYSIAAFSVLAALDFVYTRFKYTKDHMMSHEEVKKEFKESEGDPHIKQKRKQLHQEMLNQNTLNKTRKAKVLIVNPTHYAVAIDYDKERTKLPIVLAKGEGDMARRMIEVAKQENIPILREPPLARALFAEANEDEYIPSDLLEPVAKILLIISRLEQEQ